MKESAPEKITVRLYPESYYPVEHWVWAFLVEGAPPVWHNGGSDKEQTIQQINEWIGHDRWTAQVENGR